MDKNGGEVHRRVGIVCVVVVVVVAAAVVVVVVGRIEVGGVGVAVVGCLQ